MAKGDERLEQEEQAQQERRAQWAQQDKPQLWLKDGQIVEVRFLEQGPDKHTFARHEYLVPNNNNPTKPFRRMFTCLNDLENGTPCPGCNPGDGRPGLKRKTRGVYNVIQRQRPQLRKGQDNKAMKNPQTGEYIVDGYMDEVVIFEAPGTTANMVRKKDTAVNGLMSRDLKLGKNSGDSFQPYTLEPVNIDSGPQPMSEADIALAQKKHDIDEFMKPPSFTDALTIVNKYGSNVAPQQTAAPQAPQSVTQQAPDASNPYGGNPLLQGTPAPPPGTTQG